MAQSVKHKRSALLVNGSPKLPTTSQLEVGEIAINFAEGYETLSTRNNNNGIATFSSDAMLDKKYISSGAVVSAISAVTKTIEDNEYVIAQAFNNQNDRIEALEDAGFLTGYTETDPTVPAWAKQSSKPSYTASEVGALPDTTPVPTRASMIDSGVTFYAIDGLNMNPGGDYMWSDNEGNRTTVTEGLIEVENGYNLFRVRASDEEFGIGLRDLDVSASLRTNSILRIDGANSYVNVLPSKSGTFAMTSDIPSESDLVSSGFTKNALTAYTETDPTVPAWAKASTKPTYTAAEVGALSTATTYFDDVEYDSNTKRINFKKNSSVIDYVDATDFIKDGMVSSVTVSNGNLVISFNTEAGKEDIELALTQIFNPNNYYDKTTADGKFLSGFTETDPTVPSWAKASTKPTYTANEVGALATGTTLDGIADGTTRKLSDYSLTGHTHSEYASTGHSHTAAEVGAMATSERNNYLPTGTTLDNIADGSTRKLSNYSLTGHTHSEYLTTATTIPNDSNLLHKTGNETVGPYANKLFVDSLIRFSGVTDDAGIILYGDSFIRKDEDSNRPFEYIGAYDGNGGFISLQDALDTKITSADTPTEASIANSGFTKNAGTLTGVTINGTPATVSNGVASATVSGLPAVSASDNGKILQVVNGQWTLVTPTVVYTGNGTPDNLLGNNGDIYLQTS